MSKAAKMSLIGAGILGFLGAGYGLYRWATDDGDKRVVPNMLGSIQGPDWTGENQILIAISNEGQVTGNAKGTTATGEKWNTGFSGIVTDAATLAFEAEGSNKSTGLRITGRVDADRLNMDGSVEGALNGRRFDGTFTARRQS